MKKLIFRSDLLEQTNRYSADFSLPDYLYDADGHFDREATVRLLLSEEYGFVNDEGIETSVTVLKERQEDEYSGIYAGKCRKHIQFGFTLTKNGRSATFPVDLFLPVAQKDFPLVVALDFRLDAETCYCPIEEIMEHNVALARVLYTSITSDDGDFENGIAPLLTDRSDPHAAGKIAIWAYAAGLIGKYLLEQGYVTKERLYVSGHSRLGKTALLAAALYPQFAGVHSNNSGCSGVSVSREKQGETVAIICRLFPFWFARQYESYGNREEKMPFDQHYLTALIAPRKLCVATAERDHWADTEAQYLSLEAASVIYEKAGVAGLVCKNGLMKTGMSTMEGQIALTMREGPHYFSRDDWNFFLRFIQK